MMWKKAVPWVMALAVALTGVAALAMPIHYEDGSLAADAVRVNGAEDAQGVAEAIDVADFQLLCALDGDMLIFADGGYYRVAAGDLAEVVRQVGAVGIDALPDIEALTPIERGDRGEDVKALQQALAALGYLDDPADGQFGGRSQKAVAAMQQAMGIEQTGRADALTQLLIRSAAEKPVNIVTNFDPAARFAEIAGRTEADLSAAAELGFILDYDDISGDGALSNGAVIVLDASGESDIDSRVFELKFLLQVKTGDGGDVRVEPVVQVACECVRRPVMQELLLKSGDARCTLPVGDVEVRLTGARSVEVATVKLDAQALALLAGAAEAGELKFRIRGRYDAFDGAADAGALRAVAAVGAAGEAL